MGDTLISDLTVLANSWRGKVIPAGRVSLMLNSHILDPRFELTANQDFISFLHEADRSDDD